MRFGKLFCLGLLVAACWVVPGVAQARGGMHGEGLTLSRQLLHALNLTDDQRAHVGGPVAYGQKTAVKLLLVY
jgi:hypothetical protein